MTKTNIQKKKEIGDILTTYMENMSLLKQKNDSIVSHFLEALRKKRIDEIKLTLQQL